MFHQDGLSIEIVKILLDYLKLIGLVGRVFANGPGDLGSIPGRVISKTLKMVLDTSLLNTQQHKARIKGKVEQSRERNSALPYTSVVAIEKGAFWSPSTMVANFTFTYLFKTGWEERTGISIGCPPHGLSHDIPKKINSQMHLLLFWTVVTVPPLPAMQQ